MTISGHVQNGVVVFDEPITLPEGTAVKVEVSETASPNVPAKPTLIDHYRSVIGVIRDLPADAASDHDRYLYDESKS